MRLCVVRLCVVWRREQLEAILQDIGEAAFRLLPNGPGTLSVPSPQLT